MQTIVLLLALLIVAYLAFIEVASAKVKERIIRHFVGNTSMMFNVDKEFSEKVGIFVYSPYGGDIILKDVNLRMNADNSTAIYMVSDRFIPKCEFFNVVAFLKKVNN